jgi:hypothetical protein
MSSRQARAEQRKAALASEEASASAAEAASAATGSMANGGAMDVDVKATNGANGVVEVASPSNSPAQSAVNGAASGADSGQAMDVDIPQSNSVSGVSISAFPAATGAPGTPRAQLTVDVQTPLRLGSPALSPSPSFSVPLLPPADMESAGVIFAPDPFVLPSSTIEFSRQIEKRKRALAEIRRWQAIARAEQEFLAMTPARSTLDYQYRFLQGPPPGPLGMFPDLGIDNDSLAALEARRVEIQQQVCSVYSVCSVCSLCSLCSVLVFYAAIMYIHITHTRTHTHHRSRTSTTWQAE